MRVMMKGIAMEKTKVQPKPVRSRLQALMKEPECLRVPNLVQMELTEQKER